jgi:hypothetical protein
MAIPQIVIRIVLLSLMAVDTRTSLSRIVDEFLWQAA